MIRLADLLDLAELEAAIEQGFVRRQVHPGLPYSILNYTERCQYERAWTDLTRQCRGLIVDEDGWVIARPFGKFFNYGEHPEGALDLAAPAEVTDKLDGSLGILYPVPGGWAIATRGSFASEQALHATQVLRERYPGFSPPDGVTVLAEIIYAGNRIVVDYGGMDDLVLLGAVDIKTGADVPAGEIGWPGPHATRFECATLADALSLPPRPNAEGAVVRMLETGTRVKLKQADYVALHRILTTTTARTVWEFLAVNACKHLIAAPKHWGSRLGLDPARAAEILEAGERWEDRLLEGVPDEFHAWLRATTADLAAQAEAVRQEVTTTAAVMIAEFGMDRKTFALSAKTHPQAGLLFQLYDGRDITTQIWKTVYPPPGRPFADHGEDVA